MVRIYLVQNLYDLSDMATMTGVIASRAFSEFCGVDSSNQVSDGDTIGRFRAFLVEHGVQEKLFGQVMQLLSDRGLILKKGTSVDSAIIAAPPSTKKQERQRDPDAHQVKKIKYKTNRKPSQSKNFTAGSQAQVKRREREKSSVRVKVEHIFGVFSTCISIARCCLRNNPHKFEADSNSVYFKVFSQWLLTKTKGPCMI